jgi:pimeloyl-ACP methyl ester carboxylesterase
VTDLQNPLVLLGLALLSAATVGGLLMAYMIVKYTPVISRNFRARPTLMPLRIRRLECGEDVEFVTGDGLRLSGSYFKGRTKRQAGVIVYCHEYLSDRWSFHPYIDRLRDLGYDLFTFDFRSHGDSDHDPAYEPMQWTSDREVRDLRAALAYLRTRPDRDPAGFGLFGVSRGGTTALISGAEETDVWGVVTDGAFPTQGTMIPYIIRWAEIYVPNDVIRSLIPRWLYTALSWTARLHAERRLNCRFPSVEAAAARLAPRPWLSIHGACDAYISPEIAQDLFAYGRNPRELWLVPEAKHNRCRDTDPEAYSARILDFLFRFAPRRPETVVPVVTRALAELPRGFGAELEPAKLAREVAEPIPS